MRSLSSSVRRGLAATALVGALAITGTACGGASASDSDACGKGSSGGDVKTCIGVSDLSSKSGDAVIPAGTSVTFVCKDKNSVGILIPSGMVNADKDKAEWKTTGGKSAIRGIGTDLFNKVPSGLPSCDNALKRA